MKKTIKRLFPLFFGVIALFIPLVRDFHIESALVAATVGAFWAAMAAVRNGKSELGDVHRAMRILGHLFLAGLPLLINALITGCYTVDGLGFWLFYVIPSVFFGYGIGRLARKWSVPAAATLPVLILLVIAIGVPMYEFLTLPQFYFFNHIWGGWPGPIYDEVIRFNYSVVGYRFITACWALIFWSIPHINQQRRYRWIVALSSLALFISYTQLENMGIISPSTYIQEQLGGSQETDHAQLYYDKTLFKEEEIERLGSEVEFYIGQITEALKITPPRSNEKIELYLYGDPWQKKELAGAKYTSYVTMWWSTSQIHIAREQVAGSLKHELVHALTLPYTKTGFGLLPNIGLTEGVAVALDPSRSSKSTIDQLVAAKDPLPGTEEMNQALTFWGFYTGRSSVSYTTAGSFVRYLIDAYPPDRFMRAFKTGDIEAAFETPFAELIEGWHGKLKEVPIDNTDRKRAQEMFGRLSVFEQSCPHKRSEAFMALDRYYHYQARRDTAKVLEQVNRLMEIDPDKPIHKVLWSLWHLRDGNPSKVTEKASRKDTLFVLQLLYADAYFLSGNDDKANEHLFEAAEQMNDASDVSGDDVLAIRLDPLQRKLYYTLQYENRLLEPEAFRNAYYSVKMRSVRKVLEKERDERMEQYARQLMELPVDLDHFGTYLSMIHRLGFFGKNELANDWIQKLSQEQLNPGYMERLQQQRDWLSFLADMEKESKID